MEAVTATVQEVLNVKEFEGKHGTVYYHRLKMDNGTTGELGRKRKDIEPGVRLTYTVAEGEYGLKFKIVPPVTNGNGSGGYRGGSMKPNPAAMSLAYSKDLAVAFINRCESGEKLTMDSVSDRVIQIADKFQTWLKENE